MTYKKEFFSIKNWAEDDRPREKLELKGEFALSDAELLAILIGSGSKNESAVALAKRILASVKNSLQNLAKLSITDLNEFKGIGKAKAINILAALELGRRRRLEEAEKQVTVTSSKQVFEYMQPLLADISCEEFWVLYLNNSNKVLKKENLSKGGITNTLVDVRILFKKALENKATAIIVCHNHPSGKVTPSISDKKITEKIAAAGKILDIKLLDHLIITENMYFSFMDENLL